MDFFARPFIDLILHIVEFGLLYVPEISAFWIVFPQDFVDVFHSAFLP